MGHAASACARAPTSSTFPRSRASPVGAATVRRRASRARIPSRRSPSSSSASSSRVPPRGRRPSGLILDDELAARLEDLRGEIELPIPAASAVKIGGERAYRLHRRGVEVQMPLRRSRVDALDVIAYRDGVARLDLRVSSGTYVRAIAEALGGHCVTLRRTEVGPFTVEEADPERIVPPDEALARIGLAPEGGPGAGG